jgi:hypothetical protein
MKKISLNDSQQKALRKLWFIYGNSGIKHSHCNHRYIQNILEHGEDTESFYKQSSKNDLTQECVDDVRQIINNSALN